MTLHRKYWLVPILLAGVLALLFAISPLIVAEAAASSYLGRFNTISPIASTVPANGDVNPYGVAVVPDSIGRLKQNNILVSNFNNIGNLQGTGTTIVQITPGGKQSLFAQIDPQKLQHRACPGGVGLTTALTVLQRG